MSKTLALGEKLFSLLDLSSRSSTYKPALLLALLDCAPEYVVEDRIPVRVLAERVIELFWPQTVPYSVESGVLQQNQGKQATIVNELVSFRKAMSSESATLPNQVRVGAEWEGLVEEVEFVLAREPVPKLQRPFENFLYDFDWPWQGDGGWKLNSYRQSSREIQFRQGAASSLTSLAPLLRPFVTRWWIDKAALLNPNVEEAQSIIDFERFMFGHERKALERVSEGLLDFQGSECFYCESPLFAKRQVDHFVPWSICGYDGLDNLVAAYGICNNSKRATLAGPAHVSKLLDRNAAWDSDLTELANERSWPRNSERWLRVTSAAYMTSPDERPIWLSANASEKFGAMASYRKEFEQLLSPSKA